MIKNLNKFLLILIGLVIFGMFVRFSPGDTFNFAEFSLGNQKIDPPFLKTNKEWVDSVYNSLSEEEKIAQLLMIAAYPAQNESHFKEVEEIIKKYNVGGIIFFKGNPVKQAELTNRFQAAAKTRMLIAIDGEWGLSMRIDSTLQYPRQMTLGAISDDKLIYEMGAQIASQMKRMGIHINFAPVADVNNNPENPVINSRSFGEDRYNVTRKSIHYMMGLQENNVLAVAKHFPGHGDTDTDSHLKLPVITHNRHRLDSIELFPFKEIINSGVCGVMVAHLNVPALDSTKEQATTLSKIVIDSLLKKDLDFKGLVFTDAMNMGGITENYKPVEANTMALLAGNDVILMPADLQKTISSIQKELKNGTFINEELEIRCKKILAAKYWAGLNKYTPINLNNLTKDLNIPEYRLFNQKLIENAVTVLTNKNDLLPLAKLDTLKVASIVFGDKKENDFDVMLGNYISVKKFFLDKNAGNQEFLNLHQKVKDYNLIIIGLLGSDMRTTKRYGITPGSILFIDSIVKTKNVVVDIFANPYSLSYFNNLKDASAVVVSYENNELVQKVSAQLIFGVIQAKGKLPVTSTSDFMLRSGLVTMKMNRLKYSIPLEAGISEEKLYKVDSIAMKAISEMAMPGCQVLGARNGIVFYMQSFGNHTYKGSHPVQNSDLYDIASVTKITASIPSIMKMYEKKLLELDEKVSHYLPYLDTTNKNTLKVKDILLHQSRLKSWIPFYMGTLEPIYPGHDMASSKLSEVYSLKLEKNYFINKNIKYKDSCFSNTYSDIYSVPVAGNMFMNKSLLDTIYKTIAVSELNGKEGYKYSDLGYYWFYKIIENLTNKKFDEFLDSEFYKPLGTSVCFNPLNSHSIDEIAPTEDDLVFRKQLVHGYVHDMGAAMMGGVSGHAGLFASANELAKIMQLYLNKGEYGNTRFFNKSTIELFTSCRDCNKNRRGLGFDKPEPDARKSGPVSNLASLSSFGHTGFTGTMVWADPDYDLLYVFLSNRVYPEANNNKLTELNIRTKIQDVFYESMLR